MSTSDIFFRKVWDAVTGDELKSFTHKHIVKSVAFSPDGKSLLTGSNEKILRIFDLSKPETGISFVNFRNDLKLFMT